MSERKEETAGENDNKPTSQQTNQQTNINEKK